MRTSKISLPEICCMILFFLYGLGKVYIFSISEIYLLLRDKIELIIYVVMVYTIIKKKLLIQELFVALFIGIVLLYGYLTVGYAVWFRGFLMIVMFKDTNFKRACKSLFYASLVPLAIGVVLYLFGISDSGVVRRNSISWGFTTPNTFAMLMAVTWMLWLCSRTHLSVKEYIFTWIFGVLGYTIQDSRTFLIVLILLPFADMIVRKLISLRKNRIIKRIACLSQVFFMVLSVMLVKLYPISKYVQHLNPLFGGRVFLNYYNYSKYGVGLFGKAVTLYNTTDRVYNDVFNVYSNVNYSTVDNMYIAVLITMGVIQTTIFMIGYYVLIKRAWENGNTLVVVIAMIFSAYGFTECTTQEIYMNFVYLYIMAYDTFSETISLQKTLNLPKHKKRHVKERQVLNGFY